MHLESDLQSTLGFHLLDLWTYASHIFFLNQCQSHNHLKDQKRQYFKIDEQFTVNSIQLLMSNDMLRVWHKYLLQISFECFFLLYPKHVFLFKELLYI